MKLLTPLCYGSEAEHTATWELRQTTGVDFILANQVINNHYQIENLIFGMEAGIIKAQWETGPRVSGWRITWLTPPRVIPPRHPEARCQDCGRQNVIWHTPLELWDRVVREHHPDKDPMLCPVCFIVRAEKAGVLPVSWCIAAPDLPPDRPAGASEDSLARERIRKAYQHAADWLESELVASVCRLVDDEQQQYRVAAARIRELANMT